MIVLEETWLITATAHEHSLVAYYQKNKIANNKQDQITKRVMAKLPAELLNTAISFPKTDLHLSMDASRGSQIVKE